MDKVVSKENYNCKEKKSSEEFMKIYNQLNYKNRMKVAEMIIEEYREQLKNKRN